MHSPLKPFRYENEAQAIVYSAVLVIAVKFIVLALKSLVIPFSVQIFMGTVGLASGICDHITDYLTDIILVL